MALNSKPIRQDGYLRHNQGADLVAYCVDAQGVAMSWPSTPTLTVGLVDFAPASVVADVAAWALTAAQVEAILTAAGDSAPLYSITLGTGDTKRDFLTGALLQRHEGEGRGSFIGSATVVVGPGSSDADIATKIGTPGTLVDLSLKSTYVTVVGLGASNGTDDTAALNALLATAAGKTAKGLRGQSYKISAPLIVPSGATLDMTGCTITLTAACNMLNNAAVASVRRVLDAATTAASATLTSATAAFTAADNGKPVTIQGAGVGGVPLTTTLTYVNATTATLAVAASTTISGQYAAIGTRDHDIEVIGGLWDRGGFNGVPVNGINAHSLRFRHVDGLTIRDVTTAASGGKYQINPGDCTRIRVSNISFVTSSSDGVHFNGPCSQITVSNIMGGTMGDDLVSMTARDSTAVITDCAGDITAATIDSPSYRASTMFTSAVKIVAGKTTDASADYAVSDVVINHPTGPTTTAPLVYVGDISGGIVKDITINNPKTLDGGGNAVIIKGTGTVDGITINGVKSSTAGSYPVTVSLGVTVGRLMVNGLAWGNTAACAVGIAGTVNRLIVNGVQATVSAGAQSIVRLLDATAVLTKLVLSNVQFDAAGANNALVSAETAGHTVGSVHLSNIQTSGVQYPLGAYVGTPQVSANNVTATGMTAWARTLYGGVITLKSACGLVGDNDTTGGNSIITAIGNNLAADPDLLTTGEETINRKLIPAASSNNANTGQLLLTYFTARKTESINTIRTLTAGTAGTAATLCRVGVYSVAANGDLTLVASSVSDTAMWSSTFAGYSKALSAAWSKVAGQRYAIATLFVGGTAPKLVSVLPVDASIAPRSCGNVASQSDLPGTVTSGTVVNTQGTFVYASMLP